MGCEVEAWACVECLTRPEPHRRAAGLWKRGGGLRRHDCLPTSTRQEATVAVAVIGVIAVFFLGMGGYALAAPAALVRPFGITLGHSASRSEVRAVYGGFGLAIAGVLVYAVVADEDVRRGILITVGVALAGMAFGRLAAAVLGERTAFYPNWFYFLVELAVA